MKKKGIQLTLNMLVVIIISIVLLSMGVILLRNFITGAVDIKTTLDEKTRDEMIRLLNEGKQLALPFNTQELRKGESHAFGIGILNIYSTTDFKLNVTRRSFINRSDKKANATQNLSVLYDASTFEIAANKREIKTIRVEVPEDLNEKNLGTYIYSVDVSYGNNGGFDKYDRTKTIRVIARK